jgi:predicted O-methyltransferase YrrM
MSRKTLPLTEQLYQYLLSNSLRESAVLQHLRQETMGLRGGEMQISPEQGQFMALLLKLMQAQKVLEIGTFTGYSSLVMAEALPQYGKVITCDVDAQSTAIAKQFWQQGGVEHKIESRIGPAVETLDELIEEGYTGHFDFAFIDADKRNYIEYYEKAYRLVRKNGLIAIDNVLWDGKVIDENNTDKATVAIREFNKHVKADMRVDLSLIPIGDGLTLAYKR